MNRSLLGLSLLFSSASALAVPTTLSHQGRLFDAAGQPLEGEQSLSFSLYDSATSTTPLWTEAKATPLTEGYFSVKLGDTTPLPESALDGGQPWLQISVGGAPLTDRIAVHSVPFALRATQATNVRGGTVEASAISVNGVSITNADGSIPWARVTGAPADADSLAALTCASGDFATFNGTAWACGLPNVTALDAAAITTGTLAVNRLPIGSGPAEVAAGDHTHDAAHVTTGVFDGTRIPGLDAAKTTSGVFDAARIPDLDAAKITSGALATDRIPNLDAAKITSGTLADLRIPNLNAGKITSGAFNPDRIPGLDAAKISSGVFENTRIPSLDATKITTGVLSVDRLPVGTIAGTVAAGNHTHSAASVGALSAAGGTLSGALTVNGTITGTGASGLNTMKFLTTNQLIKLSCASSGVRNNNPVPTGVPSTATALLANVFTYSTADDHVNYAFGRSIGTAQTWDNAVYDSTNGMGDVLITHNGQSAGRDFYGMGHGTQIIPLKSNATFDAMVCNGYTSGTHYVSLTVFGYIQ